MGYEGLSIVDRRRTTGRNDIHPIGNRSKAAEEEAVYESDFETDRPYLYQMTEEYATRSKRLSL